MSRSAALARADVLVASPCEARPIVKWAGGKSRLVPELIRRGPQRFERYFEPFLGGGALFFALAPKRAVLGDANPALIATYRAVARDLPGVLGHLEQLRRHDEERYYRVRDGWNRGGQSASERAAMFLYLNRTCFNGLWRVNRQGHFNVPIGRYAGPPQFDEWTLRAAAGALSRARLVTGDYRKTLAEAGPGDFVYLDPPYYPTSKTARFASYTARPFGLVQQRELATCAAELVERGVAVLVSNSDQVAVRALYSGFRRYPVRVPRSINANGRRRGEVAELIFAGGFPPRRGRG